jgi:hypothetical protein
MKWLKKFTKKSKVAAELFFYIICLVIYGCGEKIPMETKRYITPDPVLSSICHVLQDSLESKEIYKRIIALDKCKHNKIGFFESDTSDFVVLSYFKNEIYRVVNGRLLIYRIDTVLSKEWNGYLNEELESKKKQKLKAIIH